MQYLRSSNKLDAACTAAPLAMMAARMCALTDFNRKALGPPTNTVWLYLFVHQLLYEKVAIMYPADSGFRSTTGAQAVETAVNTDLKDLLIARGDFVGFPPKKQSQHLKGFKVLLSPSFSCAKLPFLAWG